MIRNSEPLSLAEVKEMLKNAPESEKSKAIATYVKKFLKLDYKEAQKLKKEINELSLLKLKPEHIVKIMDIMPEDTEDIRKIFVDVSLDKNEIAKILEIIKKYK